MMMMEDREDLQLLLLTGIPASGKSTYGRWLERHKGALFIDVEEQGELDRAGLSGGWQGLFENVQTAPGFVRKLAQRERVTVLGWGFPLECLSIVRALKSAGVDVWWFDGDRRAARQSFLTRGTMELDCFDQQVSDIKWNWPQIAELMGDQIIHTVEAGPRYLAAEEVYRQLFVKR